MNDSRESLETKRALREAGLSGKGIRVFDPTETMDADLFPVCGCVVSVICEDFYCSHRLDGFLLENIYRTVPFCDVLFDLPKRLVGNCKNSDFDTDQVVLEVLANSQLSLSRGEIFSEGIAQLSYRYFYTHCLGSDKGECDKNGEISEYFAAVQLLTPFCLDSEERFISFFKGICSSKNEESEIVEYENFNDEKGD